MELPIYNAVINSDEDGIYAVSLVDCPATEVNWIAFSEDDKKPMEFNIDDVKHCLTAPLMLCDTPIYRRNGDYEFYIQYSAETLRVMAEKMLKDNTFNEIDFQHNGEIIEKGKVNLVELYIKDETKPSPFDIPNGSIICTYKINDDAIWEAATNGTFNGFSLAGYFDIEPNNFRKEENIKSKFMSIIDKLKELIVEAESEKEEGKEVNVEAEEEVKIEAEEEVKEEEVENPTEDEPNDEPNNEPNEIEDLRGQIESLQNLVGTLIERVDAIEASLKVTVEKPIEEQPTDEPETEMTKFAKVASLIHK